MVETKHPEQTFSPPDFRDNPNGEETTIDLLALASLLWSKLLWILLAAVLCGGLLGAYNVFLLKPTFSAEAKLYIANTDSIVNLQDIQISAALTQDYANIMTSRTVLKKVIADQTLDMTYVELRKMVSITNPTDTHILEVTVTSDVPEDSIRIANSLLKYGMDTIFKTVGSDEPTVIDYAEADAVTVNKASLSRDLLLGGLIGAVLVCGIVTVRFLLDNTVHGEEDVKDLGLPVLAEITQYAAPEKGKKAKHVRK